MCRFVHSNVQGQNSVVRTVTTLLSRRSGLRNPVGAGEYFLQTGSGAHPTFSSYWDSFPGVERPERCVDQSSVEGDTSAPPVCLDGLDRDNVQMFIQYVLGYAREAAIADAFSQSGTQMVRLKTFSQRTI